MAQFEQRADWFLNIYILAASSQTRFSEKGWPCAECNSLGDSGLPQTAYAHLVCLCNGEKSPALPPGDWEGKSPPNLEDCGNRSHKSTYGGLALCQVLYRHRSEPIAALKGSQPRDSKGEDTTYRQMAYLILQESGAENTFIALG